jgi:iron(III) transport system substrate-binding protein
MPSRAALVLLSLAFAACSRSGRDLPEVRLFVSPDLPGAVVADAAVRFGVARVVLVTRAEEAELAWLSDPTEALGLGARATPGSATAQEGVPEHWRDSKGRFAPLPARARVLLVGSGPIAEVPSDLRDVAGRALRGKIALVPFGRGEGPVTVAALSLTYGREVALAWLEQVAANEPQLAESAAAVRARVATGAAAVGLAGSIEGAAGAASAAGVRVVYPDQAGAGAIVIPTALAHLPGAGEGAAKLAAWLAGPAAERVLVARVPGLIPLRPEVPVPVGVEPAGNLAALPLDWDRLAEEKAALAPILARWPSRDPRLR